MRIFAAALCNHKPRPLFSNILSWRTRKGRGRRNANLKTARCGSCPQPRRGGQLLPGSDQFFPCESVANRSLHLVDSLCRELREFLHQTIFRNRSQIVAVDDAGLRHSLGRAERQYRRHLLTTISGKHIDRSMTMGVPFMIAPIGEAFWTFGGRSNPHPSDLKDEMEFA
jgi:hypothetical protein